jgi:hypothetical protein
VVQQGLRSCALHGPVDGVTNLALAVTDFFVFPLGFVRRCLLPVM